jgi:uncharacterized lipoprotein YddW (UPF0748 family)
MRSIVASIFGSIRCSGAFLFPVLAGLVLTMSLSACVGADAPGTDTPTELRGVWLTNVDSDVLSSQEKIDAAMAFLAEHHFNAVFPVVWNDGYPLYPSAVADSVYGVRIDPAYEGRDPLAEIVEAAHEHGMAVIPWFEFGFSSGHGSPNPGPVLQAQPSWAARDTSGEVLTKNEFRWMNPYRPAVRDFLAALLLEVVRNYNVDGVQGDDRLPAQPVEGGYSAYTKALYAQSHNGQPPPTNPRDSSFMRWRANLLNDVAGRIYREVKAVDATLQVSWAPSVYPWSYHEYLQDWPTWIRDGHSDLVHPQVYRRDTARYRTTLESQRPDSLNLPASSRHNTYPGVLIKVGDYRISGAALLHAIRTNRAEGYDGEILFFYEGLRENGNALADTLRATVYREKARLPFSASGL